MGFELIQRVIPDREKLDCAAILGKVRKNGERRLTLALDLTAAPAFWRAGARVSIAIGTGADAGTVRVASDRDGSFVLRGTRYRTGAVFVTFRAPSSLAALPPQRIRAAFRVAADAVFVTLPFGLGAAATPAKAPATPAKAAAPR